MVLTLLLLMLLVVASTWVPGVYREYQRVHVREQRISEEVHALYQKNEQKRLYLRNMMDDPGFLQQQAREQLGYVLPGEVVYRIDSIH